jgi:uncharacterized peroxidase-related enzyme
MTHHGAALRRLTRNPDLAARLAADWRNANLSATDLALCDYAEKLTLRPQEMKEGDVAALREAGLDDRGILDTCQIVAYFNFVTRLAEGLGVELEEHWAESEKL